MFGFCDGLEKTGGEVCSVFSIKDFWTRLFKQYILK